MEVKLERIPIVQARADCAAVALYEGDKKPSGDALAMDKSVNGAITQLLKEGEIQGKRGEVVVLHTFGSLPFKRVIVVGLGRKNNCDMEAVRFAAGTLVNAARAAGARHVASALFGAGSRGVTGQKAAQAITEGALLAAYSFERYKKSEKPAPGLFTLASGGKGKDAGLEKAVRKGTVMAAAQNMARDMANEPSTNMTPTILAGRAKDIAKEFALDVEVLSEKEAEKKGMGAFLGVARGTDEPAKFIVVKYRPLDKNQLALVGKGITFDSGGISIKPSEKMDVMKGDMSGAAAVLSAMWAIAQFKPRIGVLAIVPATENMPSGHAMKPGDILRSLSGQTIEVENTDAEGRLALADAITYAGNLGAKVIVDVATLTGACVIALGEMTSGLLSNDDRLANMLLKISRETGEKMWRLPTFEEYDEQIKSDIADVKNSGGRPAGTITAGMFLKRFAGERRWAHIDIAGKEMSEKARGYQQKGMTGVATRTLVELALRLAQG